MTSKYIKTLSKPPKTKETQSKMKCYQTDRNHQQRGDTELKVGISDLSRLFFFPVATGGSGWCQISPKHQLNIGGFTQSK